MWSPFPNFPSSEKACNGKKQAYLKSKTKKVLSTSMYQ